MIIPEMSSNSPKKMAILMAAYNGQKYLSKQLDSILAQNYPNWTLYVIDDGSKDETWNILHGYQASFGEKLHITKTDNKGCAKTFLSLACDENIQADYYAYSDQDDIWDNNKLSRAVEILGKRNDTIAQ